MLEFCKLIGQRANELTNKRASETMFIADLHIHSKYSRATSKGMDLAHLAEWAKLKGISLLGTGDFTHHLWLQELKSKLKPKGNGIFSCGGVNFILTAEVSNIYSKNGRGRRVHNIIFAPDFATAEKINNELAGFGNLSSDGRPMLGLDCVSLVEIILGVNPDCFIVPAHIFTPWYSVFGSNSGFDTIDECFEKYTKDIYALETGLSSDPGMDRRWSALDRFSLISNSDAHCVHPDTNIYKLTALEYRTQEQYDNLDPIQQANMDAEKAVYDAFVANKAAETAAKAALSENEHYQTLDNLGLIKTLTL